MEGLQAGGGTTSHLAETEKLIRAVHRRSPLWKPLDKSIKDKKALESLWREVAAELGVEDCNALRKRWKSLRDYYRSELTKWLESHLKQPNSVPFKSSWPFFDIMAFTSTAMRIKTGGQSPNSKLDIKDDCEETISPSGEISIPDDPPTPESSTKHPESGNRTVDCGTSTALATITIQPNQTVPLPFVIPTGASSPIIPISSLSSKMVGAPNISYAQVPKGVPVTAVGPSTTNTLPEITIRTLPVSTSHFTNNRPSVSSSYCQNPTDPSTSTGITNASRSLQIQRARLKRARRIVTERFLPYDTHARVTSLEKRFDESNDEDLQFLKSLLPYLKVFDMMRKMKLRTKFQELICSEMENAKREENPELLEDVPSPCVILKQEPPDSGSNDA